MLTLTSQYALRAMVQIAQANSGERLTSQTIAQRAEIPPKYLSAILRGLTHVGILNSLRGATGGYQLRQRAEVISLYSIVQHFEPQLTMARRCPFGNQECGIGNPCSYHEEYQDVVNHEKTFLESKTLADLSARMKVN